VRVSSVASFYRSFGFFVLFVEVFATVGDGKEECAESEKPDDLTAHAAFWGRVFLGGGVFFFGHGRVFLALFMTAVGGGGNWWCGVERLFLPQCEEVAMRKSEVFCV